MQGIKIELTRTERAIDLPELESAFEGLERIDSVIRLNPEDDTYDEQFPQTRDQFGRVNPIYDLMGNFHVADVAAVAELNGFKSLRAFPYRIPSQGDINL